MALISCPSSFFPFHISFFNFHHGREPIFVCLTFLFCLDRYLRFTVKLIRDLSTLRFRTFLMGNCNKLVNKQKAIDLNSLAHSL